MFAEVLVPYPLPRTFTYRIPAEMDGVAVGSRVLVQFGSKRFYTGIVASLHCIEPDGYEVKDIAALLDSEPIVRHPQLKFWQWIADYYLCTQGEVYKAAVPSGLKVESETVVQVNPDFEDLDNALTERQRTVLEYVQREKKLRLSDLAKATGYKNLEVVVHQLLELDAVHVSERAVDNYRPKTETMVALAADRDDEAALHRFFDEVSRAKKQEQLRRAFLERSRWMHKNSPLREVSKAALMERTQCSATTLRAAIDRGMLRLYKKEINRFASASFVPAELPTLSAEQREAHRQIIQSFGDKDITLLHGVTSSGKTSIYMHLIADTLARGEQALFLVPEIALTTQLTQRMEKVFGDKMLVYHSKFSDNERVDIWKKLLHSNESRLVIGVRSSIFLPFARLGLVIIDEEHDSSYKQADPAPRYNGRSAAMMLARMHGAKTLLGSATPAIETYYWALQGRYGLVTLSKRYEDMEMPDVQVINTKEARRRKEMSGIFSPDLVRLVNASLADNRQAILFQNRRGFSPMVRCKECGSVPQCVNCDVSLTYHRHISTLKCHYCGHTITMPPVCPACQLPGLEVIGYGTERIEDEVERQFPDRKIARMDLDTTRAKLAYEQIIEDFSQHKSDILVGTQMVTKGLDFDGVSVVGILNADTMTQFPDFRSHERAFNMLEQVAGRAGRKGRRGVVALQTSDPANEVISFVQNHDYRGFYDYEVKEREKFNYPPFTKIINIYLKHRDDTSLIELSARHSALLRQVFGNRVLGPEAPYVAKVQNLYIRQTVLKMELSASMPKVKTILRSIHEQMLAIDPRMKSCIIYYDVDPS